MTSIPATKGEVEALTSTLPTADLFALVATALNELDRRGENTALDGGFIAGESTDVVWDQPTERYTVEAHGGDR